ncbi:hypothetical protein P7C70_g7147, partial [Phenoliferia sp. Uapishka_3]
MATLSLDFDLFVKRLKVSGPRPAPLAWKTVEEDPNPPGPRTRGHAVKRSLRYHSSPSESGDQDQDQDRDVSDANDDDDEGFVPISLAKRVRQAPPRLPPQRRRIDTSPSPPLYICNPSKYSMCESLKNYERPSAYSWSALGRAPPLTRFQDSSVRNEPFPPPTPDPGPQSTSVGSSSLARLLNPTNVPPNFGETTRANHSRTSSAESTLSFFSEISSSSASTSSSEMKE